MSKKITQLPAASAANLTDLLEKTNDPSGTPVSQKLTLTQLVLLVSESMLSISTNGGAFVVDTAGNIQNQAGASFGGDIGNQEGNSTWYILDASGATKFNTFSIDEEGNVQVGNGIISLLVDGTATFGAGTITFGSSGEVSFADNNLQIDLFGNLTTVGYVKINNNAILLRADGSASFANDEFQVDTAGNLSTSGLVGCDHLVAGTDVTIASGTPIKKVISSTATLNFGSTAAGTSTDLTVTLTGAALGDCVQLGVPHGSTLANGVFSAWVSAANTVTVRFTNTNLVTALDPASGTFRVAIMQF